MKLVLTGGIGAGKSAVAELLRERGFAVLDADVLSRKVAAEAETLAAVARAFGARFVENGVLDRRALRAYVFGDKSRETTLNAILRDPVVARLTAAFDAAEGNVVAVVPLYFECGMALAADEIWTVSAPVGIRIQRTVARDTTSEATVRAIVAAQWTDEAREARADRIIRNTGDLAALGAQVAHALGES